ncbi:hypothetical protein ABMA28_002547 [Loxostege sticticalis]|uniref:Reverse transcriptase domain-containing protein n=1 Tax=Loxostege sticticalis TaxID=481309 RepID=A0ABD0SX79_LOXSC
MGECGVGQPLNQWFRDYLTSRSFRVKVGDALSETAEVKSLCNVLQHCSAYMFADDLCTLRTGTDLADTCRLVQRDIDAVVKWSHDNGIILNSDKTNLLIIHSLYLRPTGSPPFMYTHSVSCLRNDFVCCNCMPIKVVVCVTYLGVKVDNNFYGHIM